jgi:hypothetical protein
MFICGPVSILNCIGLQACSCSFAQEIIQSPSMGAMDEGDAVFDDGAEVNIDPQVGIIFL